MFVPRMCLLCLLGIPSSAVAAQRPSNVLMIVADDQGWGDFGFMGHQVIQTPHLDKLAAESALFPNGYVPTSLCRASLATLLTGLYGHQHNICCNDPATAQSRADHPFIKNSPALPRLLKEKGYRSLQTGKFWEGHFANAGFTHGETTDRDRHIAAGKPQIGRQTMKPIYDFIDDSGDRPFFVWYAPMMPHQPHNPPERLLKKYAVEGRKLPIAKYWAMCEWFDETCGQLLDYLDQKKLRDNTLVLFVVDNGWIQDPTKEEFTAGSKMSPYDGGIRTPVMLRWPGHTKPGRYKDLVSTVDLVPTILAACGLKPAKEMPGLSLLDVAAGKGSLKRKAVFGEIYVHKAKSMEKPALNLTHRWVREGDWKLILGAGKSAVPELYNLANDPKEKKNLAAGNSEKAKHLGRLLDDWWTGK